MKQFYLWIRCRRYKPNGGKPWGYREAGWLDKDTKEVLQPRPCYQCKGKHRHRRYMLALRGSKKGQALCIWHYVSRRPVEADRLMRKLVRPLSIGVLSLILIVSGLTFLTFNRSKILFRSAVTNQQIENVVDWAMTIANNVPRETLRQEIETVNEESEGNTVLFVAGVAMLRVEGVFDPSHIGKKKEDGRWVPSGARGTGAVLESHLPELIKAHVKGIKEKTDLNHPVYGTRASMFILRQCRQTAKGNTMRTAKIYLQGEGTKYEAVSWNMSLEDYFKKWVNTMGEIMLVLDTHADAESPPSKKTKVGDSKDGDTRDVHTP